MKNVCLYHDDPDGRAAAAVVLSAKPDTECRPVDYGKELPITVSELEHFDPEGLLFIVDFSVKDDELKTFQQFLGRRICWIDHHKTAKTSACFEAWYKNELNGRFDDSNIFAACMLAWHHFYPTKIPPLFIELVSDYDTWKRENQAAFAFVEALNTYCPGDPWAYQDFLDDNLMVMSNLISNGQTMLDNKERFILRYVKLYGVEYNVEQNGQWHKALSVNVGPATLSDMGHYIYETLGYDLAILWVEYQDDNEQLVRKYSLRSDGKKFDCSKYAEQMGGGGHAPAASFIAPVELEVLEKVEMQIIDCKDDSKC